VNPNSFSELLLSTWKDGFDSIEIFVFDSNMESDPRSIRYPIHQTIDVGGKSMASAFDNAAMAAFQLSFANSKIRAIHATMRRGLEPTPL
jgi:hypothetical protein